MQLKWLVVCVVVGVQAVTAAVVAVTAWSVVIDAIEAATARSTRAVADTVRLRYERFVDPANDAVDLARFLLRRHGRIDVSLDTFERFLFNQLGEHPVVDALYLGRSSGEFIMVKRVRAPGQQTYLVKHIRIDEGERRVDFRLRGSDFAEIRRWRDDADSFDPRTRPWFQAAREHAAVDGRLWTEPYVFFTSGEPGVSTANAVIGDDEATWGAVSVDIETGSFSRFLTTLALPGGGEAFIADWRGEVVALPATVGPVGEALFAPVANGERPAILAALTAADPDLLRDARDGVVVRDITVGGRDYIVQLLGFEGAGMPWSIVVAVPTDAIFGWIYRLRDRIMAASAAGAALAVIGLLVFWRRAIERPLSAIGSRLNLVARGEEDTRPPVAAVPELRAIDSAVIVAGAMIAERESARVALIDQLTELAEAMEAAPVGIVILSSDRHVSFANRLARETFSVPASGSGRLDPAVLGMSPETFLAKLNLVLAGRTVRSEMSRDTDRGGHFGIVLSPLGEAGTSSMRVLLILEDVTTAKALETGLVHAREAAEQSDRAKTLFLAQMSHEFRTPLNAIVGFSHILRSSGSARPERVSEYARDIHESAAVLLEMIDRILEFARFESGEADTAPRPTDVEAALRGAVDTVGPLAADSDVTIDLDILGPLPQVAGEAGTLARAFEQLLSNAVKFSRAGGTVSVAAAPRPAGAPPGVAVGIVDRGRGIDVADLPRIFDPFWKGSSPLHTQSTGPGLGLSIARRIIESFGGRIDVDSALDEGTRVVATLPVLDGRHESASNDG